jgi:hypothetical protein
MPEVNNASNFYCARFLVYTQVRSDIKLRLMLGKHDIFLTISCYLNKPVLTYEMVPLSEVLVTE